MPRHRLAFSNKEVEALLQHIGDLLPIAGEEWDEIEHLHAKMFPKLERLKDTLKCKFQSIYLTKSPTCDPQCPPNVRLAKHIYNQIKEKADISEGEEEPDIAGDEESTLGNNKNNNVTDNNQTTTPVAASVLGAAIARPPGFTTPMTRVGTRTPTSTSNPVLDRYLKILLMEKEEQKEQQAVDDRHLRQQQENHNQLMQLMMMSMFKSNNIPTYPSQTVSMVPFHNNEIIPTSTNNLNSVNFLSIVNTIPVNNESIISGIDSVTTPSAVAKGIGNGKSSPGYKQSSSNALLSKNKKDDALYTTESDDNEDVLCLGSVAHGESSPCSSTKTKRQCCTKSPLKTNTPTHKKYIS
jgi:hypothetical protein